MIATMALASCGTENDDVQIQPADTDKTVENTIADTKEQITFKAVYSNGDGLSKTAIKDRTGLVFSAGDKIRVFDGTDASVFDGDITDGTSATCNFTGTANPAEIYYAVYPSSAENMTASSVSAKIPTEQNAEAGTFDKNAHVMVASASGTEKEFKFKTANAFIRFTAPRNLKSVVMTGNNGEAIAGNITVSGYSDIAVSGASATSITLSGTMEKGKEYYISYAPAKFAKGITLTLTDENDNEGTYATNKFESKPNQVNNIKEEKFDKAFYYTLPAGESLGDYLASFTGEVAEVILEDYSSPNDVKTALTNNSTKKVKLVLPESVTTIGYYAFYNCNNLVSIEMPGVTSIGKGAFFGCTSLALISLPKNLTSIGDYAFCECSNLALTSLPKNLTSIGDYAFYRCTSLALISLPENVTSIGMSAFEGCTSLALTTLPEKVTSIEESAFLGCTSLALTSLPKNVASIGNYAFYGCTSLALNSLPNGVTSIGNYAFLGCTSLALTSLPENLTSIGETAFDGCTSLALTSLPENVASIGKEAFFYCKSLEQITILSKVEKLGNDAFYGCSNLKSITILGNPEIGDASEKDDYDKCTAGTVINVSEESYNSYTDYWKAINGNSNITVKVNEVAIDDLP